MLQIIIAVLCALKRYNHIKCIAYETFADNDCGVICIEEIVQYMTETVTDNDCGILCIKEIQPRKI